MLSRLLKAIASVHTEYGTEIGLTRLAPASFNDLTPYLHSPASPQNVPGQAERDIEFADEFVQPGDDVAYFEGDAEGTEAQSEADLTGAFEGPDLMHVIHNVTNALRAGMNLYPDFLAGLRRIPKLLSEKESKQQLIQTCFSDVPGIAWREEIQGFHGSVHQDYSCRVGRNAQASSRAEGEFGHDVAAVDRDLSSDAWWASLTIMLEIAAVQRRVADWANSCLCHGDLPLDDLPSDVSMHVKACPLRGRRSAEIASGDFFRLLERLFQHQHHATVLETSNLLARLVQAPEGLALTAEDDAATLEVLDILVSYGLVEGPPWKLSTLGHAHLCERVVLQKYEPLLRPHTGSLRLQVSVASSSRRTRLAA